VVLRKKSQGVIPMDRLRGRWVVLLAVMVIVLITSNSMTEGKKGRFIWLSEADGVAEDGVFVRTAPPAFHFRYPVGSTKIATNSPNQVMAMKTPRGVTFLVAMAKIPQGMRLKDIGWKAYAPGLKKIGSSIKVISNREIMLKDGTKAYRTSLKWLTKDRKKRITTIVVSAFKDDKWVFLSIHTSVHPEKFAPIAESLTFGSYQFVDTEPPEITISSPVDNLKTSDEKISLKGKVNDNVRIARLQVILNNEVFYERKNRQSFYMRKKITLAPGKNFITVEAVDEAGNKARKSLSVFKGKPGFEGKEVSVYKEKPALDGQKASVVPLVKFPSKGERYAVIIGIGKYQDERIPKLKYSTLDAESIYHILTNPQYGNIPKNHVQLLLDEQATNNKIKSAIGTWLSRKARKDDTVTIFFAGHGAPEDEQTYWVTYNADIDDLYGTALSNDDIAGMLERVQAEKMIVFLDSCYSAATINRTDSTRSVMIVKDPFNKFKGKGRVIITSSNGKEKSLELKEFGHGVFTYYLLEALKGKSDENKDGHVELDEVWDYVKYRVTDTARKHGSTQTPVIDGSYSAGILLSKNPGRLRELSLAAERENKERELESKIHKLTELYNKGEITSIQFDKAISILESGERSKLLDDFLSGSISLTTFKRVFR
jgi:uncharacterized caspase-like protein/translation initiation factor IF-1